MKKNNPTLKQIIAVIENAYKDKPDTWKMHRGFARKLLQEQYSLTDPWESHGYSWTELATKMGKNKNRVERTLLSQASKHASIDKLRKLSNSRLSWGDLYNKKTFKNNIVTIVVASDFHDIECDKFAYRMFMYKIQVMQPDIIVLNGDVLDLPEFGKYDNDPREYRMNERIEWVNMFFAEIRKTCPSSQIDYIEGNHEARFVRYLANMSPMMSNIMDYVHNIDNIKELFGLETYKINYVAKGNLGTFSDYQMKKEVLENEKIYFGLLQVTHIKPNERTICINGISGHYHRLSVSSYKNSLCGSFLWVENGAMHLKRASFTDGNMWNIGFSTYYVDTKKHDLTWEYTEVGVHHCVIGGVMFERTKKEYMPFMLTDRG